MAGYELWKIMTQGLTMKIVFFSLSFAFSMSFKEQLLAENLLARGHKNITIKQISLTKNCCFSGSVLGFSFLELCEIRFYLKVCVSLQKPSVRHRSFPWWRSRVWTATLPLEAKWCSWAASTSSLTPRWCLWRKRRVSSCHPAMFTAREFPLYLF